jgi:hypothetical protein
VRKQVSAEFPLETCFYTSYSLLPVMTKLRLSRISQYFYNGRAIGVEACLYGFNHLVRLGHAEAVTAA